MKNILSRLLCACTLCMAGNMAFAQNKILLDDSFQNEAVTMEVLESSPSKYTLKVQIHGLFDNQISNSSGDFHWLSFGLDGHLPKVGYPSLPLITRFLAIPSEANCSASISEVKWTDVEMGRIYPTQPPRSDDENIPEFVLNDTAYSMPFTPAILSSGREMKWRDIKNVTLTVCPFKYDATQNRLSVLTEFVLQVNFLTERGTPVADNYVKKEDEYRLFDNDIYVENEQSNLRNGNNSDDYDYLIIVDSETGITIDNADMKKFRMWKAIRGYKTKVTLINEIFNAHLTVKEYIDQEYNNHAIKYVLFVGKFYTSPLTVVSPYQPYANTTRYIHSDYVYGCMDGSNDYQAEIPIGRFSILSLDATVAANQFRNMVNKVINYERDYSGNDSIILVAHKDGAGNTDSYQACCDSIRFAQYLEQVPFVTAYGASVTHHGDSATNADVVRHINNRANIINYRGHGDTWLWGNYYPILPSWNVAGEAFKTTEINNMNDSTCSVFLSVACHTANIDADSCMLEKFTRSAHGAVAFLGSTTNSYTIANNMYNRILYDNLLNKKNYRIGDLNIASHITNMSMMDVSAIDNALSCLYGGDPSLEIWTKTPKRIKSVAISISNDGTSFQISAITGSLITIVSEDGELIDTVRTGNNRATFTMPSEDKFYVTINKHNYYPCIILFDKESHYIQNQIIDDHVIRYYISTSMAIGEEVDLSNMTGDVIICTENTVKIRNGVGGTLIDTGFECEKGALLEIK